MADRGGHGHHQGKRLIRARARPLRRTTRLTHFERLCDNTRRIPISGKRNRGRISKDALAPLFSIHFSLAPPNSRVAALSVNHP